MRKLLLSPVFLFLALELSVWTASVKAAPASEKVRVAVIASLSGEAASWGEAIKNGIALGLDQLSPAVRSRLEVRFEDDALQPKNTITAFNKLNSTGGVDIVINPSSATSMALAPLVEVKKITMLAIATDPEICRGRKYVFNFWVTPETEAQILIPEAVRRGYRKIARITSLHNGTLAAIGAFDQTNHGRLEVVVDEQYPLDIKDFRQVIAKVRLRNDVDAIMLTLLPGQLGIFAKQARESGLKQPFFGWETFEDVGELKASNNALVGAWYVNAGDSDGRFIQMYRERFPKASFYSASNAFDAILLIGKAVEGGFAPGRVNEFLATLEDFQGALGTYSATGDQRFLLPAAVKMVTESGFETLR